MTFEEFQATRVRVDDLRPLCREQSLDEDAYTGPAYVYLGCLVIEINTKKTPETYSLIIANCEYVDYELTAVERILHEWATDEGIEPCPLPQ